MTVYVGYCCNPCITTKSKTNMYSGISTIKASCVVHNKLKTMRYKRLSTDKSTWSEMEHDDLAIALAAKLGLPNDMVVRHVINGGFVYIFK